MMAPISFSKYSGCGNDFILIDNRLGCYRSDDVEMTSQLCDRRLGIGADGLILLEESCKADFKMRIFNADGSEAEMCGNGVRCFVKFLQTLGLEQKEYQIEAMHRLITAKLKDEEVCVGMGNPEDIRWHISMVIKNQTYKVHHIDTGVPHLILFDRDAEHFPITTMGPYFRHHPDLLPKGANFNVATLTPQGDIINRTYERGVEGETLACGTGCTAVALAAGLLFDLPSPIRVHTRAGDLNIGFDIVQGKAANVTMSGPAEMIYTGRWCGHKRNKLTLNHSGKIS